MSQKLTVQALIDAGVPARAGNLCPSDSRFYQYLNSFEERALSYGRWWGTTQLMQFCVTPTTCRGTCIVLPREVAVVEAMTVGGTPIAMRNQWYSYIRPHAPWGGCGSTNSAWGQGSGPCGCGCGCGPFVAEDNLTVPSFATTLTGQRIRFYFDPSDVGKTVLVQGYDENHVWVRTLVDGAYVDGELVTFATTGGEYFTETTTAWYVGSPTGIQKEVTNKSVYMFAAYTSSDIYNPDAGNPIYNPDIGVPLSNPDGLTAQYLAVYQAGETLPSYRKLYLPRVPRGTCSSGCGTTSTVRCIVSLAKVPVAVPTDWLLFSSVNVYLDGVKSEVLRDNNDIAGANAYFFGGDDTPRNGRGVIRMNKLGGALPTLQAELRKMTGDVTTTQVRRAGLLLQGFV